MGVSVCVCERESVFEKEVMYLCAFVCVRLILSVLCMFMCVR